MQPMLLTRRHLLATVATWTPWTPALAPQQRRAFRKGAISMSKPGEYTYKCESCTACAQMHDQEVEYYWEVHPVV